MAISPMLCVRPGISFGLRNATQKKTTTTSALTIARSIGLVKWNEPIEKKGFHSKSCRPGAGKPHPLKMWQPPAGAAMAPVTGLSPLGALPSGGSRAGSSSRSCPSPCPCLRPRSRPVWRSAEPPDDEPERNREPDQHADREEHLYVHRATNQPADAAVGSHAGE